MKNSSLTEAKRMMSTAKITSMAMAKLLVVMLKVVGRFGRTYDDVHDQLSFVGV
jgi:hypothetical protein